METDLPARGDILPVNVYPLEQELLNAVLHRVLLDGSNNVLDLGDITSEHCLQLLEDDNPILPQVNACHNDLIMTLQQLERVKKKQKEIPKEFNYIMYYEVLNNYHTFTNEQVDSTEGTASERHKMLDHLVSLWNNIYNTNSYLGLSQKPYYKEVQFVISNTDELRLLACFRVGQALEPCRLNSKSSMVLKKQKTIR
jgi:hypothetical protein